MASLNKALLVSAVVLLMAATASAHAGPYSKLLVTSSAPTSYQVTILPSHANKQLELWTCKNSITPVLDEYIGMCSEIGKKSKWFGPVTGAVWWNPKEIVFCIRDQASNVTYRTGDSQGVPKQAFGLKLADQHWQEYLTGFVVYFEDTPYPAGINSVSPTPIRDFNDCVFLVMGSSSETPTPVKIDSAFKYYSYNILAGQGRR